MADCNNKNPTEIVVVGSNMIDLLSKISRLPKMGETLAGNSFHLGFGGKGANQAVMASRLGASVGIVTKVGDDIFGPLTKENFKKNNISTEFVYEGKNISSGVAPIFVDEEGRNLIVIVPGANLELQPREVRGAAKLITGAKIVISQLEIPDAAILEAFYIAKKGGAQTILNPAPAREISIDLIKMTDILVPNESEAELLTGILIKGKESAEEAAQILTEFGAKNVILTLGEQGVLLCTKDGAKEFPAFSVEAIDTTGAGDAFIGGLAYAIVKGNNLSSSIRFAIKCAAVSVTRMGTQSSFPILSDVINFGKR